MVVIGICILTNSNEAWKSRNMAWCHDTAPRSCTKRIENVPWLREGARNEEKERDLARGKDNNVEWPERGEGMTKSMAVHVKSSLASGEVLFDRNMSSTSRSATCGENDTRGHSIIECTMARNDWALAGEDTTEVMSHGENMP
ncbi:hypothetical protein TRIUR3_07202 [Triticum urartu]|uniref:Uncharacterized protein n=2 Tax=Triticum TaxID=4564 RepID=A0A9R0R9P8_TRITD|nr:hypothetical protein TRIUR3_07202 [Triticum urartu]VAH55606.1 unnamed protein product [Triticum turgidum subsp. durum]